ncbi:MAG TPA: hypothetical protein VGD87_08760 [Archangium sp.]
MNNAFAVLAAVVLSGCVSISSVQRADTLGAGNLQVGVEPGAIAQQTTVPGLFYQGYRTYLPGPHLDASLRMGITDRIDLGVRAGFSGVELQSKFMLTERDSRFTVSLAPTAGGSPAWVTAALPVLVGIGFGRHQLVLGARVQGTWRFPDGVSASNSALSVGGSLGFAFRVSERLTLLPELALAAPVAMERWDRNVPSEWYLTPQLKLGFLIEPPP